MGNRKWRNENSNSCMVVTMTQIVGCKTGQYSRVHTAGQSSSSRPMVLFPDPSGVNNSAYSSSMDQRTGVYAYSLSVYSHRIVR